MTGDAIGVAIEAYEAIAQGQRPELDSFCAGYPEIEQALHKALTVWTQLDELARSSRAEETLAPPQRLGPYLLRGELGRGGMAPVYRALDTRLDREIALKVLPPDPVYTVRRRDRFLREARALARLPHPHIVRIHDVGEDGPWCWFAMECMEGSLSDALEQAGGRVDPQQAVSWILQAAEGVAHAHLGGVLHRDLKPANLLLGDDGLVRVADFGVAQLDGDSRLTLTGQVVGTPAFVAPELLAGEESSVLSDVYGLGACLYNLITGHAPATGVGEANRLRALPRRVRPVVERALASDPAARYPDIVSLVADLRALQRGRRTSVATSRWRPAGAISILLGACLVIAGLVTRSRSMEDTAYFVYLRSRDARTLDPQARAGLAELPDRVALRTPAGVYDAFLRSGLRGQRVELERHGRVLARFALPRHVGTWRFRFEPWDYDNDGLPDVPLTAATDQGILKWSQSSWNDASLGWRRRVGTRFEHGSPALVDWDGDAREELLIGDLGDDSNTPRTPGSLHVVDLEDGSRRGRYVLDGAVQSTPQVMSDPAGNVVATYLDTNQDERSGFEGVATLWRFGPDGSQSKSLLQSSTLSWPVFHDVDGDGVREVLIGSFDEGGGSAIYCLRYDLVGEPLWRHKLSRIGISYLLLTDQSGDRIDDLCFAVQGMFMCIRIDGPPSEQRELWSVPLHEHERVFHEPVALADRNGDGLEEVAFGTSEGRVLVLSAAQPNRVLREFLATQEESAQWRSAIYARVAVLSEPSGQTLVAATSDGSLFGFDLGGVGDLPVWSVKTSGRIVASPIAVGSDRFLAANFDGWLQLYQLSAMSERRDPTVVWSFRAEAGIGSTPVVRVKDGREWAYFTDMTGFVYGIPLVMSEQ